MGRHKTRVMRVKEEFYNEAQRTANELNTDLVDVTGMLAYQMRKKKTADFSR